MKNTQTNGITILLGLKGFNVENVWEEDDKIIVQAEYKGSRVCPYCGSDRLYRHGRCKPRRVLHTWTNGKKVYLSLHLNRWKCLNCNHTFCEGRDAIRPYSRFTKQAEDELLWQLRNRSFSQIKRDFGISYTTVRRILKRRTGTDIVNYLNNQDEIYLGIDEHSFRHQNLIYTVTEIRKRRMLAVLGDDRIASLREFLMNLPKDKVKEVCIDMKPSLKRLAEGLFPSAKVVVDPFHVVADANRRVDEARRIEQEIISRRVRIPKRLFLIGKEKLNEEKLIKLNALLDKYPTLRTFYWAKERIREMYKKKTRQQAKRILDNIILNLSSSCDAELNRWANTLKRWYNPILNHFDNYTTNGFTEGCNTKIKMLKRISFGLKNVDVYRRKIMLGFLPPEYFHRK